MLCGKVLLSSPTYPQDNRWKQSVRRAASRVSENEILKCLRNILTRLHALDYEKICFVCEWLCDLLADEESSSSSKHETTAENCDHENTISETDLNYKTMPDALVSEISSYHRYHETVQFLSEIQLPPEATSQIPNPSSSSSTTASIYDGLHAAYLSRLPLWMLL